MLPSPKLKDSLCKINLKKGSLCLFYLLLLNDRCINYLVTNRVFNLNETFINYLFLIILSLKEDQEEKNKEKGFLFLTFSQNKMKTYGKQSIIKRELLNLKTRFAINPIIEKRFNKNGVGLYVPQLNKARVGIGVVGLVVCVITPFTNWLSLFVVRWALQ